MRRAPSSLITSPFSIWFSTMCRASAANSCGQPQDVEGADQVHPEHRLERLKLMWTALRGGPLGPPDAGTRNRDPQSARGLRGLLDRGLGLTLVGHVAADEARAGTQLSSER